MPRAKPCDPNELNTSTIAKLHSNEAAAWALMERLRWPNGPVCPHCGVVGTAYFLTPQSGSRTTRTGKVSYRRVWKCADCREPFSVLVGTIFEDTKLPLSKWIMAVHHLSADKNGMSAHELHRTLGITYKSAWFMAHRIRCAMQQEPLRGMLTGTVEGYFSQLKRSIDGTHHHVSEPHLPRYPSEFDFRYNTRKENDSDRMARAIRQSAGKRLRYKAPAPRELLIRPSA